MYFERSTFHLAKLKDFSGFPSPQGSKHESRKIWESTFALQQRILLIISLFSSVPKSD